MSPRIFRSLMGHVAVLAIAIFLVPTLASSQSYPTAFDLSTGDYSFTEWAAAEWDDLPADGKYPPNMIFHYIAPGSVADPVIDGDTGMLPPEIGDYEDRDYNRTSQTRINGLGNDGIAFVNTGTDTVDKLGHALIAIDTSGRQNIQVTWVNETVEVNNRTYAMRLQYRVGLTGTWTDADEDLASIEYVRSETQGHTQTFGPVTLPGEAEDEELVHLRWVYYRHPSSGTSGNRAMIRLDDILVTSTPVGTPAIIASVASLDFPNSQIGIPGLPLSFEIDANDLVPTSGTITVGSGLPTGLEISGDGETWGTSPFQIVYTGGEVASTPIHVRFIPSILGGFSGDLEIDGGGANLTVPVTGIAETEIAFSAPFLNFGQVTRGVASDPRTISLNGFNLIPVNGEATVGIVGDAHEISLNGEDWVTSPLLVNYENGWTSTSLHVRALPTALSTNTSELVATDAGSGIASVNLSVIGQPPIGEIVVPAFIQGISGTNNNRTPVAFLVELGELEPNSTYRALTRVVPENADPTVNGAGNAIQIDRGDDSFAYRTSQGLSGNHNVFTTDSTGSYKGWFIAVPSSNAVFTTGEMVRFQLILNDGNEGESIHVRARLESTTRILDYDAPSPNNGVALYTTGTMHQGKSFAVLYTDVDGATRPVAAAQIEDTDAFESINPNLADFLNGVLGVDGSFGMIVPADLPDGIRRIEIRDLDGEILNAYTSVTGVWPSGIDTVNPTGALVFSPNDLEDPESVMDWFDLD